MQVEVLVWKTVVYWLFHGFQGFFVCEIKATHLDNKMNDSLTKPEEE